MRKENCRPDGRELGEFRATTLNIGSISTADGSALVKIGNTTVICGIKAELATPPTDAPNKGYIVPNVDLPPLCSSRFRPGPPGEQAQAASQFIADLIDSSTDDVRTQGVEIFSYSFKFQLSWVLYCDIMCLDYDGNLLDACVIALLAALENGKCYQTFRNHDKAMSQLPEVTINKETELAEVNPQKLHPLNVTKHPVGSSFAVFDNTIVIVDPTAEEESLSTATITVVTDEDERLCALHKPGGSGLSAEKLQDCISRAVTRHREVRKLIEEVLKSIKPQQ
ncbi:exosome complex component RRP43-like [Scleropages formosus]|uniref:Ribosomal RNA-processing protein 43 n=1 Tax=Scleropages formosus TaxID=113540 RepID=A0A0P7V8M6_SCLFO|nr:exosome complex component RRP43-like [Scleropages formosus]